MVSTTQIPAASLQSGEEFDLTCVVCGHVVAIEVAPTQLYRAMNELGWALIPTQHGREVSGLCRECSGSAEAAMYITN